MNNKYEVVKNYLTNLGFSPVFMKLELSSASQIDHYYKMALRHKVVKPDYKKFKKNLKKSTRNIW